MSGRVRNSVALIQFVINYFDQFHHYRFAFTMANLPKYPDHTRVIDFNKTFNTLTSTLFLSCCINYMYPT